MPTTVTQGIPADQASLAELAALERRGDPSGCAATFLSKLLRYGSSGEGVTARTLDYDRRAVIAAPEILDNWGRLTTDLQLSARDGEAEVALRSAIRTLSHPSLRVDLYFRLIDLCRARGDTASAGRLARALDDAVQRDRRPWFLMLAAALRPSSPAADSDQVRLANATRAWPNRFAALAALGQSRINAGDPASGLSALSAAVALADSLGRPYYQLRGRMWRGRAYAKLGRHTDAERDLRRALAAGDAAPDVYYLAETWHNLAHVYEAQGRWAAAAAAADRFVALSAPMRYDGLRMMSLRDAGVIRWKAGWHAAANADFGAMIKVVDDQHAYYYWAGEYFERIGDVDKALAYYREDTRFDRRNQDPTLSLAGLARLYEALAQDDSAWAAARAHDARVAEWRPTEGPILPAFLARHGRAAEAIALDRSWVARQLRTGNVEGAAIASLALADLLLASGYPDSAAAAAAQAESLATSLHLTDQVVAAGTLRGRALTALGDRDPARRTLEGAAALAAAHPTVDGVLTTQLALGGALAATRPEAALAAYDRAARTVERVTIRLGGDMDRAGYRERHLRPFEGALHVLLGAEHPPRAAIDAAVLWSQRRKATALALGAPDAARAPNALGRAALQRRLGPREALVDYLVTDSLMAAIVVTHHHAAVVRLAATRDSLRVLVERLRRPLVTTFAGRLDLARAAYDPRLAHALYEALVRPIEPVLAGRDRWLIVPDGPLYALPFAVLVTRLAPAGGSDYAAVAYLIDRVQVSYLPGGQFLSSAAVRAQTLAATPVLAVANDAAGSAREVAAIRTVFSTAPVRVLAQDAASESVVRADGPRYGILHSATHAEANDADPLASYLRLAADSANDGYWHVNEIAGTRWHARLVVLSACETVGGRLYEGEGLMGLARAFLSGGAGAVVATQWPVGATSAEAMAAFYGRLAAGTTPDAALRDAQLALRQNPATSHPFYWGGFVIVRAR